MMVDTRLEFASAKEILGGNELSTNVIDIESLRDFGHGQQLYCVIQVTFGASGGTGCEFVIASDASASIDTAGSASEHVSTGLIPTASLDTGAMFVMGVPAEGVPYEQFVGVLIKTTGSVEGCFVDIFMTTEPSLWTAKADSGIN